MSGPVETGDGGGGLLRYEEYAARVRERSGGNAAPPPRAEPVTHAFAPEYYERVRREWEAVSGSGPARERASGAAAVASAAAEAAAGDGVTDELTGHNYDGIQEYDNPTPGWWYALFYASIVFAGLYIFVYHSVMVPSLDRRHASAEAAFLDRQFAELNELPNGEPKILAIMRRPAWLARGEAVFSGTCAQCHAGDGSGSVGPNLTDESYSNVSSLLEIVSLIETGTANGAMPAQKNLLNDNEIALVTAYVASLRGKNLPTGETVDPSYHGVPIPPWPTLDERGEVVPVEAAGGGGSVSLAR